MRDINNTCHLNQATADAMTLFTVTKALDPKNVTRVRTRTAGRKAARCSRYPA